MKTLLLAVGILSIVFTTAAPKCRDANGHPTDFNWYNNKYQDFWELADSSLVLTDTLYTYRVGATQLVFNQDGEFLENYHIKVW